MQMGSETGTGDKIDVACCIVRAVVSIQKISYHLPVMLHVEGGGRKGVTAGSLSAELFPGLLPLSQRMLSICEDEGLVRSTGREAAGNGSGGKPKPARYRMTEKGQDFIASERTFIRDTGRIYKIYYTDNDAIPLERRVLVVEANPSEAGYSRKNERNQKMVYVPDGMEKIQGTVLTCFSECYKEFKIEEIEEKVKWISNHGMSAELRASGDEDDLNRILIAFRDGKEVGRSEGFHACY